jgi:hypothetical protein
MPQHAVSASQGGFEDLNAADRQGNALPDAHHDAHTFSPPLAGNDVSAFDESLDHSITDAAAHAVDNTEQPRDGNNDNIPSGQALVIMDSSTTIAAAGQSTRPRVSKPAVAIGVLTLLGLGAAAFSYNGLGEPKNIAVPPAQLASVSPSLPEANAIVPVPSAPEATTASIAAAPPPTEVAPAPAATAQPESVLLATPVLEEKTALVAPEATPQPRAALPEPGPALAAAEPAPARAAAELASPPAQEEAPAAAVPPQITPNNLSASTPAQPARSVTPPPAGPARGQFVFVQRPNVNIRNAPSDRGQIIGIAQFGGRFVVARSDGEWVQVAQGPWRGWIKSRFLSARLPRG